MILRELGGQHALYYGERHHGGHLSLLPMTSEMVLLVEVNWLQEFLKHFPNCQNL